MKPQRAATAAMLAVCGGKGGVGKTTAALGVGRALAEQRRRSLLVDADADMPDLHAVAGTPAKPGLDALVSTGSLDRASHAFGEHGLEVVPATPGADVAAALRRLSTEPGVVVDCPAGGGRPAANPLRAADRAVVVTTRRPAAIRGASKTAAMARELGAQIVGSVVTRADDPGGVGDALDAPVLGCVPESTDPLSDPDAVAAYRRIAAAVRTG